MIRNMSAATIVAAISLILCISGGCLNSSDVHRVNGDVAMDVLTEVLQSWKDGKKPEDLTRKTPPVTVQDLDWMRGMRLLDFQIQDQTSPIDANLHCRVKLTMVDTNEVKQEKSLYI